MKKNKYIYLVYCNPKNPLVYGIYLSKKPALKYAKYLIDWRLDNAKVKNFEFGYYHYVEEGKGKETDYDKREKTILSACLKIKDNYEYSDDACLVQVIRRSISK